jgi:hypothetical protein
MTTINTTQLIEAGTRHLPEMMRTIFLEKGYLSGYPVKFKDECGELNLDIPEARMTVETFHPSLSSECIGTQLQEGIKLKFSVKSDPESSQYEPGKEFIFINGHLFEMEDNELIMVSSRNSASVIKNLMALLEL